MIFSKGTFYLEKIADDGADFVTVDKEGNSFAANDYCWAALSPVPESVQKKIPLEKQSFAVKGAGISHGTCKEMIRALPKDTTFGGLLENTAIEVTEEGEIEFLTNDGRRKRSIWAKAVAKAKVPFTWLKSALSARDQEDAVSIVLNRKRLMALLEIMDKTCPDPGKAAPLWLTLTKYGKLVLRGVNPKTDQRFLASMRAFEDTEWILDSEWEKSIVNMKEPLPGSKPAKKRGCARRKK